jgi:hypothetical protein
LVQSHGIDSDIASLIAAKAAGVAGEQSWHGIFLMPDASVPEITEIRLNKV